MTMSKAKSASALFRKAKTTEKIVRELADALAIPDIPLSMEVAIGHAIARLVEQHYEVMQSHPERMLSEPKNRELDNWREFIRDCDAF